VPLRWRWPGTRHWRGTRLPAPDVAAWHALRALNEQPLQPVLSTPRMQNGYRGDSCCAEASLRPSAAPKIKARHLPAFCLDSPSASPGRAVLRLESRLEFGKVEPAMMLMRPGPCSWPLTTLPGMQRPHSRRMCLGPRRTEQTKTAQQRGARNRLFSISLVFLLKSCRCVNWTAHIWMPTGGRVYAKSAGLVSFTWSAIKCPTLRTCGRLAQAATQQWPALAPPVVGSAERLFPCRLRYQDGAGHPDNS
jgi:hypothetical protein